MPSVETKPILNSEEVGIVRGLSPQDQAIILDKINQGRRLAEILALFSAVKENISIPITKEVQQSPVRTIPETQYFPLYSLRRAAGDSYGILCGYGLEHAAKTIFEPPKREENDLSYEEAILSSNPS
ncbi:MAG: hypothetical protein HYY87_03830 [Candidatus Levybacteria bacterium]|nr:hypothetical protein [Candidatus Levybacteria bacterium]MBI3070402.1 hypothetical protein [Candidatus Levybacteria bacterium]MBI3092868.1 hypothetical protein [Candidatus Levybacteria bacterium]